MGFLGLRSHGVLRRGAAFCPGPVAVVWTSTWSGLKVGTAMVLPGMVWSVLGIYTFNIEDSKVTVQAVKHYSDHLSSLLRKKNEFMANIMTRF